MKKNKIIIALLMPIYLCSMDSDGFEEQTLYAVFDNDTSPPTSLINGETRFHKAVRAGDFLSVTSFCTAQTVNQRTKNGRTPLHLIGSGSNSEEIARYLLDNGADYDASDNDGNTPLMIHIQLRNTPIVRLLILRGASADMLNSAGNSPRTVAKTIYKTNASPRSALKFAKKTKVPPEIKALYKTVQRSPRRNRSATLDPDTQKQQTKL